jgi:hypothetical protein
MMKNNPFKNEFVGVNENREREFSDKPRINNEALEIEVRKQIREYLGKVLEDVDVQKEIKNVAEDYDIKIDKLSDYPTQKLGVLWSLVASKVKNKLREEYDTDNHDEFNATFTNDRIYDVMSSYTAIGISGLDFINELFSVMRQEILDNPTLVDEYSF